MCRPCPSPRLPGLLSKPRPCQSLVRRLLDTEWPWHPPLCNHVVATMVKLFSSSSQESALKITRCSLEMAMLRSMAPKIKAHAPLALATTWVRATCSTERSPWALSTTLLAPTTSRTPSTTVTGVGALASSLINNRHNPANSSSSSSARPPFPDYESEQSLYE